MYRYLLFDLDGTLTNSEEGITKSVDYALRTVAGIETEDLSTLTPYIGPPLVDGFKENHHLDTATAERCRDAYRERYREIGLYECHLYAGIAGALEQLHAAGRTLALATSKPEFFAKRILAHFDLTAYFTAICGASMDGRVSQKGEVIALALHSLGYPPAEQTLMIGDRFHDVQGAAQHGLKTLGVLFGFGGEAELTSAGALALVHTPQEMAQWLLEH